MRVKRGDAKTMDRFDTKQTMRAVAVFGAGDVRIVDDVPIPKPNDYEVLVKVVHCGFCNGSDFQIILNTMEETEGLQPYPTILGHEGVGYAVKLGKKVRYIKPGDRFIHNNLHPDVGAGYSKTYGGMAEYGLVADHRAMIEDGFCPKEMSRLDFPFYKKFWQIPRDFPFTYGAMLLSLSESLSAAKNFGVTKGSLVLVFGAGPMGTAVAAYSKIIGADFLAVVDGRQERLDNAKTVAHADQIINFEKEDIKEALQGRLFDVAIDAVGLSDVLIQASSFLKPGGTAGSMGVLKKDDLRMNLGRLKNNTRLHMLNFPFGEYDVMDENIRLIREKKIRPEDFYSHIVPMEEIGRAMELVKTKQALKVILNISPEEAGREGAE